MGWYLRKSLNLGPLRINLSKTGIGASAGVPGARFGVNGRGKYFHGGAEGLYFRESLEPSNKDREGNDETNSSDADLTERTAQASGWFLGAALGNLVTAFFKGLLRGR